MEQWFLKITAYAEELLSGHEKLSKWPEHVLQMQKNWIGKSVGALVNFEVPAIKKSIEVFTTRIDTIYGATFLVLSPEHPLTLELISGLPRAKREEVQNCLITSIAESRIKKRREKKKKSATIPELWPLIPLPASLFPSGWQIMF
jgi:Leucyl-tRNA synthetase